MLTWIMFPKFLDDMEQVRQAEAKLAGKRYHPTIEAPTCTISVSDDAANSPHTLALSGTGTVTA